MKELEKALPHLSPNLIAVISEASTIKKIPQNTEILREGQYVKVIPLVLDGLVKVFTRREDKELLLYYIKPEESCIMSFAAGLKEEPCNVFAMTEEETTMLLIPTTHLPGWLRLYPDINSIFFQQYNLRYAELLDTIHHLLFQRIDQRLYNYLNDKVRVTGKNPIKISHRQIANELGTAREVISRVMKKLESQKKLRQQALGIELL